MFTIFLRVQTQQLEHSNCEEPQDLEAEETGRVFPRPPHWPQLPTELGMLRQNASMYAEEPTAGISGGLMPSEEET